MCRLVSWSPLLVVLGFLLFLSECVSWSLGRLCWLYWVSFCLSECVLLPLVVGGWGIFSA